MLRPSLLALLALALVPQSIAIPPAQKALVASPVHTTDSWRYVDCGLPTDSVVVQSIMVSPDPPQPGKDLTVTVKGRVAQTIDEGAYADVTVKLGVVKLLQKQFDVCQEARNGNATIQCPVEPGDYTVVHTVALPREIPRAKFRVSVRGYNADESDMVCVDLFVDFMKRPFLKLW